MITLFFFILLPSIVIWKTSPDEWLQNTALKILRNNFHCAQVKKKKFYECPHVGNTHFTYVHIHQINCSETTNYALFSSARNCTFNSGVQDQESPSVLSISCFDS